MRVYERGRKIVLTKYPHSLICFGTGLVFSSTKLVYSSGSMGSKPGETAPPSVRDRTRRRSPASVEAEGNDAVDAARVSARLDLAEGAQQSSQVHDSLDELFSELESDVEDDVQEEEPESLLLSLDLHEEASERRELRLSALLFSCSSGRGRFREFALTTNAGGESASRSTSRGAGDNGTSEGTSLATGATA